MIHQSNRARRSVVLVAGTLLLAGSQLALAAQQQLGGRVVINARDISTSMETELNFGEVKVGASGGTVTISNDGGQNVGASGDVVLVGGANEGALGIIGEQNWPVTITLDQTFTLTPKTVAGAAALTVSTSLQNENVTLTAENGQVNTIQIGGTLTIPGNQPADTYEGSYTATVNYQ